jgi:dTMP kinase
MSASTSGRFVTFEGIDGAGKSTHLDWVRHWLEARAVDPVVTREPGGTRVAEAIRQLLLDPETHVSSDAETLLVFAARCDHLERIIRPALAAGRWVLCDRFTDATLAYQGYGRGVDLDRILTLAEWVHGGLWPDLTLVFDVPEEVGASRRQGRAAADRFELEEGAFHARVREGYLALARRWPNRIRVINGAQTLSAIQQQLEDILLSL